MSANVLGSVVFCCSALFSFCLVRDNTSRQCVVKEVSAPSFPMLLVQLHKKCGWWESSPRKKGILQPEIFVWFVLQEEGKGQEGAGKLPLKSFGQTIAFNICCKGRQYFACQSEV